MLSAIHPKLPMRDKSKTKDYYVNKLGFNMAGDDFEGYLMMYKDNVEIHFFEFTNLDPLRNYGQVYIRTTEIDAFYNDLIGRQVAIHPNGKLENKRWGQKEFSLLDPDNNLLTFGESTISRK